MTLSRIFWPIVGILLLLLTLSACGTGLVSLQGNQAQQTATQKPATRSTTPPTANTYQDEWWWIHLPGAAAGAVCSWFNQP